jgi:Flp pilus assembly protein TadD
LNIDYMKGGKENKYISDSSADGGTYRILIYLIPFFTIPIIHISGAVFPGYNTWGFNYWSLFDLRLSLSILLLSCLLMIPAISANIRKMFGLIFARPTRLLKNLNPYFSRLLISIALICLFFFLRSRAHIYGDGYLILSFLSPGGDTTIGGQHYLQLLSIFLYRLTLPLLANLTGLTIEESFGLINALGGVVGFWGLYGIARRLTSDSHRRIFLLGTALTSGATIMFFGYIETYVWALALALWSLYFALGYIRNKNGLSPLIICATLAFFLHVITLPYLITALIAMLLCREKSGRISLEISFKYIVWAIIIGTGILAIAVQTGGVLEIIGLSNVFVTTLPLENNSYWFLSPAHLVDIINLCILVAPLGLSLSLFYLIFRTGRAPGFATEEKLLGILSLTAFLVSFWLDPLLGAVRDWDILSFFGFPLTLWAAYRFSGTAFFKKISNAFMIPLILVILVHNGPNLYEKNRVEIATTHLDGLVWESPHYQVDYFKARRALSWGGLLRDNLGRDDLAAKYLHRLLSVEKKVPSAWSNLAYIYSDRGMLDSAANCLKLASSLWSDNSSYLHRLAFIEQKQGRLDDALKYINRAERLDSNNSAIYSIKGIILHKLNRFDEALASLRQACNLNPTGYDEVKNLGVHYASLRQHDSAYVYLKKAHRLNPRDIPVFNSLILEQLALAKEKEAAETLQDVQTMVSGVPDLEHYKRLLLERSKGN